MSSKKPTYIPPVTTFILGRNSTTIQPSQNGDKSATSKHWDTIREKIRKGNNGFSVPDENSSIERKPQGSERKKRYPKTVSSNADRTTEFARRKPPHKNKYQSDKARKDFNWQRPSRKSGRSAQPDDIITISQQQNHFSAPDRVYDGTEEQQRDSSVSPVIKKSGNQNGYFHVPDATNDPSDSSAYKENPDVVSDSTSEIVPLSKEGKFGRTSSVYDPEDVRKRTESIGRSKIRRNGGVTKAYDDSRKPLKESSVENLSDGPMYDQIGPANEDSQAEIERSADDMESVESDIESEYSSQRSQSTDDSKSLSSISENADEDPKNKSKKKGKLRFVKKCAPAFAKKILNAIEKKKNECQLCLDDVAAKYKKQQMEKGEPVFTSYSCENGDESNESFRSSMKKRVSNLLGGFYCKACSGVQMISDILFDEEKPENDGTWTGIEGEYGVRCVPNYENTIEDYTIYICSCCFNQECDRHVFVNTKYLDQMYGCRAPVFVTRSFENLPPHCEKMLSRMSEKGRETLLKIAGKKCDMKGGVNCCSKVKPNKELDYISTQEDSTSLAT